MVRPQKLVVRHPPTRCAERKYIMDLILRDFLGLDYESQVVAQHDTVITTEGESDSRSLVLRDILLQVPEAEWLTDKSLPSRPLKTWWVSTTLPEARVTSPEIQVIYGTALANDCFCGITERRIDLGLDIFGSAFFMLTRYEEVVSGERDIHNRFPASASLAYQEGFLERPIIDEYVEVLWSCMKRLWPGLERKKRAYHLILTHDVDYPLFSLDKTWSEVLRSTVGDLVKRSDLGLAYKRLLARAGSYFGMYDTDPYNTFNFIMDVSEKNGLKDVFYFLPDTAGDSRVGDYYSLDMPWIRRLMRTVYLRGHEVGLHGSYGSYTSEAQIRREFDRLLVVASQQGIEQQQWGSRQHYLRWETPTTWRVLEQAGICYDSTLAYADHVGFRCGVCHEYYTYDLKESRPLNIREKPLIVMDTSLIAQGYMELSFEDARRTVSKLCDRCRIVDGEFVLLCHNNVLSTRDAKEFYLEMVEICQ